MVLAKKSLILVYAYAFVCKKKRLKTLKKQHQQTNKETRKKNTTILFTSICKAFYDENMIDTCNLYRFIPHPKKNVILADDN